MTADLVTLNADTVLKEHICCALADKKCAEGVRRKKEWLTCRFAEGLVFRRIDARGKVFIEFLPAEYAWSPIDAPGYIIINCLWVAGSFKGQGLGAALLDDCLEAARDKAGVVVVAGKTKRPFLADGTFFKKYGFEVCDTAPPYFELLVRRIRLDSPLPRFRDNAKLQDAGGDKGLVLFYSDQCPFTDYYADELERLASAKGMSLTKKRFANAEEARNAPSAYPAYSLFHDGQFLTNEIVTESKFIKLFG